MEKQRSEPTLVQKAFLTVEGFDKVFIRLQQQVTLRGQSKSKARNPGLDDMEKSKTNKKII